MTPRERRVQGAGIELSVRDHAGGQPPILALHGLASNARWWDLVAAHLDARNRVVAPDMRGHGRSDRPDDDYSFTACIADLTRLSDALELGPAIVVGHSWGASVALGLAVSQPERVLGLVLVDGGVADLKAIFGSTWTDAEAAMQPPDLRGLTLNQIRRWIEVSPLADATDVSAATDILLGNFEEDGDGGLRPRLSREHHMEIAHHLYDFDNLGAVARIEVPVLLLVAVPPESATGQDRMRSLKREGVDDTMARLGERGAVVLIEGEHDLPVQRPEEVASAIRAFAESITAATGH